MLPEEIGREDAQFMVEVFCSRAWLFAVAFFLSLVTPLRNSSGAASGSHLLVLLVLALLASIGLMIFKWPPGHKSIDAQHKLRVGSS